MTTFLQIGLANAVCAALLAVPAVIAGRLRRPALAHGLWRPSSSNWSRRRSSPVRLPWLPADAVP